MHLRARGANLSVPGVRLWTKQVLPKIRGERENKGKWGNMTENGTWFWIAEDGIRLIR